MSTMSIKSLFNILIIFQTKFLDKYCLNFLSTVDVLGMSLDVLDILLDVWFMYLVGITTNSDGKT